MWEPPVNYPAEDVISGAAKPGDLCRCSYQISGGLNAGGDETQKTLLINSPRCVAVCGVKKTTSTSHLSPSHTCL